MLDAHRQQLLRIAVETATPAQRVLMLLRRGEQVMQDAIKYLEVKDFVKAHHALVKAQLIAAELINSFSSDEDLLRELCRVCEFIIDLLIQANVAKDTTPVENALKVWQQLISLFELIETRCNDISVEGGK